MNRIPTTTLAAAAVATLFAMSARADVIWQYAYEGDVDPIAASPAWTISGTPTITTDGSALSIDTSTGYGGMLTTAGDWDSGLISVEVRIDTTSMTGTSGWNIQVGTSATTNKHLELKINYGGHWTYVNNSGTGVQALTGYNVVLVTLDEINNVAQVDLNGSTIYTGAVTGQLNSSSARLSIWGGNANGTAVVDYVKWPTAVPEPASMTLLTLGGLIALRRRG